MDMKYYFKMAYFNIIRNKKSVIINIILISIAFTILLTMSSISTSIQSYIDKKVVNTPLHRTLLSEPFMIWEKGLEEEIYRIISNNNRIIEAHEYFMPNLFDVVNSEEIFGETSINKDRIA
ncbi:hypothetical protein [Clostridiisalibacter paucivorans]|uniref:hypothetical protein n=1 Tax=Clostridiisalibacter paucivorans TaxID=408753 RepID=UPI00047B25E9|nr:hypothetical protein [Clostridiisalibacter paucivorans]